MKKVRTQSSELQRYFWATHWKIICQDILRDQNQDTLAIARGRYQDHDTLAILRHQITLKVKHRQKLLTEDDFTSIQIHLLRLAEMNQTVGLLVNQ